MALSKNKAPKMRKEGAKTEVVGTLNPLMEKMREGNMEGAERPAAKVTSVIIGWYCRRCAALHKPTEACPVTNLRMEAEIYDSF